MVKVEKIPSYSLKKLEKQVKKTRAVLALLEAEIEDRKTESQHEAIDQLEDRLDNAGASLISLAGLMSLLLGSDDDKDDEIDPVTEDNKSEQ